MIGLKAPPTKIRSITSFRLAASIILITYHCKNLVFQCQNKKDNRDTFPPKKLTESKLVKEVKDGKEWFHSESWYRFVEYSCGAVMKYKLMNYLKFVTKDNLTNL